MAVKAVVLAAGAGTRMKSNAPKVLHDLAGQPLLHWVLDSIAPLALDEIMVVGGANLYAQTIPLATRMYLTHVHQFIDGDTRFPDYEAGEWREVARERHAADGRNPHDYSFVELQRQ